MRALRKAFLETYPAPFVCVAVLLAAPGAPFASCQASSSSALGSTYQPSLPLQSDDFPLTPDSRRNPAVPAGETFSFELSDSKVFPQTTRTVTVYIPAAYTGRKPACVYVGLDGLQFDVATVFDNLIAQGAMPITIGIGISPGVVSSAQGPGNPRFDRSFEFDTVDDRLARLLLEEVLPEVQRRRTSKGEPILLSTNPDDRAIGGASTGGIASFNLAWQRPDAFHRVFSSIGTFVGMRGGERLYIQVRKTEPKPIRVFLQDGVYDQWPGGPEMGDWWMSNQTMERALAFAGYDVRHVWGSGTHNTNQATAVFPAAMRWLWRDWPVPIQAGDPGNPRLSEILQPGQDWELVAGPCGVDRELRNSKPHLAANAQGEIFVQNGDSGPTPLKLKTGRPMCLPSGPGASLAFDSGGELWRARPDGGVALYPAQRGDGRSHSAAEAQRRIGSSHRIRDFLVRDTGDIYALTAGADSGQSINELWLFRRTGEEIRLDGNLAGAAGLAFSPDGSWLIVTQSGSHLSLSYRVLPSGLLDARAPFYDLETSPATDTAGAGAVAMDTDGRAYIATRLGVQVMDRNGRLIAILPLPESVPADSLCFGADHSGGAEFGTLYVVAGGTLYRRKLRSAGLPPASAPLPLRAGSPG